MCAPTNSYNPLGWPTPLPSPADRACPHLDSRDVLGLLSFALCPIFGIAELWPRGLVAAVRNLANFRPPSTPVSAESAPSEPLCPRPTARQRPVHHRRGPRGCRNRGLRPWRPRDAPDEPRMANAVGADGRQRPGHLAHSGRCPSASPSPTFSASRRPWSSVPPAGAVTAALDGLVLSARMATTQRSLKRVAFNASAPAIATWTAAQVFAWLAGAPTTGSTGR